MSGTLSLGQSHEPRLLKLDFLGFSTTLSTDEITVRTPSQLMTRLFDRLPNAASKRRISTYSRPTTYISATITTRVAVRPAQLSFISGALLALLCLGLLAPLAFSYGEDSPGTAGTSGAGVMPRFPEKPFFPPREPGPYVTPEMDADQYDVETYRRDGYEPQAPIYRYELPKGAMLSVILLDDLTTQTAMEGQPVMAAVAQNMYVGPSRVLSTQDRVVGQVVRVDKPIEGRNAILEIRFSQIELANGPALPINAVVDTGQKFTYWGGQLTQGTELKVIPYHIYQIGSYGRAMYHGPKEKGVHITLPPGERLVLTMQQPVKLYGF